MIHMSSKFLLSLLLAGAPLNQLRAADSVVLAPPPLAGPLHWTASEALIRPAADAHGIVSIKDNNPIHHESVEQTSLTN